MVNIEIGQILLRWLTDAIPCLHGVAPELHVFIENSTFCIEGISEGVAEFVASEKTLKVLRERITRLDLEIQEISLKTIEGGGPYKLKVSPSFIPVLPNRQAETSPTSPTPPISDQVSEILSRPDSTGVIEIKTDKIITGSAAFARQVGFLSPFDPLGLNTRSTWIPAEYEKLHDRLNQLGLDVPLGTAEEPYEYVARSLAHKEQLKAGGLPEWQAVEEANLVRLGVICRRSIIGGALCRVTTVIDMQRVNRKA